MKSLRLLNLILNNVSFTSFNWKLKLWKFGYLEQRLIPNPDFRQDAQCCGSPVGDTFPVSGSFFPTEEDDIPGEDEAEAIFVTFFWNKEKKKLFFNYWN